MKSDALSPRSLAEQSIVAYGRHIFKCKNRTLSPVRLGPALPGSVPRGAPRPCRGQVSAPRHNGELRGIDADSRRTLRAAPGCGKFGHWSTDPERETFMDHGAYARASFFARGARPSGRAIHDHPFVRGIGSGDLSQRTVRTLPPAGLRLSHRVQPRARRRVGEVRRRSSEMGYFAKLLDATLEVRDGPPQEDVRRFRDRRRGPRESRAVARHDRVHEFSRENVLRRRRRRHSRRASPVRDGVPRDRGQAPRGRGSPPTATTGTGSRRTRRRSSAGSRSGSRGSSTTSWKARRRGTSSGGIDSIGRARGSSFCFSKWDGRGNRGPASFLCDAPPRRARSDSPLRLPPLRLADVDTSTRSA